MADLETLRPEVKEAIHDIAIAARLRPEYQQSVGIIRAELLRLVAENHELRAGREQARNDRVDEIRQRVDAEAELAALKAKIANAPAVVVQGAPGAVKASFNGYGCFEYAAANLQPKLRGKRVRLLVEE